MSMMAEAVDCGVTGWVKHGTLRWSRHVMRKNEIDLLSECTTAGQN